MVSEVACIFVSSHLHLLNDVYKVCFNIFDFALTKSVQNINGIVLLGNYLVREKGKRLFCTFMTKRMYMLLNQYMDLLTWKKFSFEAISDWCTLPKAHWSGILDNFYLITNTLKKIPSRTLSSKKRPHPSIIHQFNRP